MNENTKTNIPYVQGLGRFVQSVEEKVQFTSPRSVAEYLLANVYHPFDEFEQEEFVSLLLDAHRRVTHWVLVSRGTVRAALVRPPEVFRAAIRANAVGMIVAHNHPSGEADFSGDDMDITRRLVEAGQLLDIPLFDHLVIGRASWASMREVDETMFNCIS